jgi:hypothetical protein
MYARDHHKRLIQRILLCYVLQGAGATAEKVLSLSEICKVSFYLSANYKMLHEEISPDGAKFVVLI